MKTAEACERPTRRYPSAIPIGAQALTFTLENVTDSHVHPHALHRTKGNTKEKTWIHAAQFRDIWKAVVYKTF